MMTDDIVALLPDLRAFARFMCREREAADDLVQNTVLAALDKQKQFEPGTNLKGWLFTIMRNRFYSDLRSAAPPPHGGRHRSGSAARRSRQSRSDACR